MADRTASRHRVGVEAPAEIPMRFLPREPLSFQFGYVFNMIARRVLRCDLRQTTGVGAVAPANHYNKIALLRQLADRVLAIKGRLTDCIIRSDF
jgi:hypothetical protein